MHTPRSGKVLVIGFGSDLCGEDVAGRIVADAIARWDFDNVKAVSVHQLGPEFAKEISEAQLVIFVDAFPADQPIADLLERAGVRSRQRYPKVAPIGTARITHPTLIRLSPAEFGVVLGHAPNPSMLLLLARVLFGRSPRAYLVGIPATHFQIGDEVSSDVHSAIEEAIAMVKELALWTPRAARRQPLKADPQRSIRERSSISTTMVRGNANA